MAASSYPSSYRDYQTEARDLVQALMATCLKEIAEEVPVKGIRWPKGDQFTQENCMASIEELIQSWELDKSWLHHINYTGIRETEGGGRIVHCYCAMFSQPSRRKPVPRATASVFFFLVPPPMGESREETMVFYVIESQRVVLRPSSTFCEVWLRKVISSKLAINSSISL